MIKNKKYVIPFFIFFIILIFYVSYHKNNHENFFNWSKKKENKEDDNKKEEEDDEKYIYIIDKSKNNNLVSYDFNNKEDKNYMHILGEWDYMSDTIYCNVKNIKNNIISKIRHIGYAQYF